ncbi:hypothetical protein [Chryseobacterium sp. P1-3]|nr:hypothetical protein [Chryseobacterium sp. P1-3]
MLNSTSEKLIWWDVLGIAITNNISPENQTQALGLAALAVF